VRLRIVALSALLLSSPSASAEDALTRARLLRLEAQYEEARRLFVETCSRALVSGGAREAEAACLESAVEEASAGDDKAAARTLKRLIRRLESDDAPGPLARALVAAADIESGLYRLDDAVERLRAVAQLLPRLSASERIVALTAAGEFYLSIEDGYTARPLISRAVSLLPLLRAESAEDLRAATALALVLVRRSGALEARRGLAPLHRAGLRLVEGRAKDRAWVEAWVEHADAYRSALDLLGLGLVADRVGDDVKPWRLSASGSGYVKPELIDVVEPEYTKGGQRRGATGEVVLRGELWPDGRLHGIRVAKPLPFGLSWRALGAVRKWRCKPAEQDGKPVRASATVEVSFRLRPR